MSNLLKSRVVVRVAVLAVGLLVVGSTISSSGFGEDAKPEAAKLTAVLEAKKPEAKPAAARYKTEAREQIEKRLVGETTNLDFTDTPLSEAMRFIGTLHNFNVVLEAKALEKAGVATNAPITIQVSGISLASALNLMLEPLGLSYTVGNDVLKITAKPAAARDETEVREQIEKTLVGEMTNLDFTDTPLSEAMQFIGTRHKINVVLDVKALEEAAVAKDAPISVQLSGISLASAMKIMLEPLGLSYVVDDEVLKITTGDVAENHLDIRVYDVRALVDAGYQPKKLAEVIMLKMDGVSWTETDGEGGSVVELPDGLVVSQTQHAHREIAKVLKQIERHAASKRPSKQPGNGQATVPSNR